MLADLRPHRLHEGQVPLGEVLEGLRDVLLDAGELLADLLDPAERRRVGGFGQGLRPTAEDFLEGAGRLRELGDGVLQPRGAHRERLEALIAVRDQAPDRLVPADQRQDLGLGVPDVAGGRPPHLRRDLVHQRDRGLLDGPQPLLEPLLDPSLVAGDEVLDPLGDGLGLGGRATGEEAAAPRLRPLGRVRRIRSLHGDAPSRGRRGASAAECRAGRGRYHVGGPRGPLPRAPGCTYTWLAMPPATWNAGRVSKGRSSTW